MGPILVDILYVLFLTTNVNIVTSSVESTTLISPFLKVFRKLKFNVFIVLLFQDYCYIASPSSRVIFFPAMAISQY